MQEDFKEYLKEARQKFCNETQKYNVKDNLKLRTEVDSFLIAYDQAVAKALTLTDVVVNEAESLNELLVEGMPDPYWKEYINGEENSEVKLVCDNCYGKGVSKSDLNSITTCSDCLGSGKQTN